MLRKAIGENETPQLLCRRKKKWKLGFKKWFGSVPLSKALCFVRESNGKFIFWWIGNMADVSNEKIIIEIVVCFFSLYFPISTWSLCRLCPSRCCDNTQQVSFIVIIASIFKFQINCHFAHFSPLHLKHTWKYILDIIWVNPPFKTNTEKMQLQ